MSDKMKYFSLGVNPKDKSILLAVKHDSISDLWVGSIKIAQKYLSFSMFNKPVPIC